MPRKGKKFTAHFNRINMQRGDSKVWTVHQSHVCHQVTGIVFNKITMQSIFIPDGKQPRAKFEGYGTVIIKDNIAYVG